MLDVIIKNRLYAQSIIITTGKGEMEGTTLSCITFYPNITPMVKYNMPCNRKSQPCSFNTALSLVIDLLKFVKYLFMTFSRYSNPRILYADFNERMHIIQTALFSKELGDVMGFNHVRFYQNGTSR